MNEFPAVDSVIMQGIDHLDFRPDKFGNQDIVGMVSAEDEVVAFSNVIYPIDAKVKKNYWSQECQSSRL